MSCSVTYLFEAQAGYDWRMREACLRFRYNTVREELAALGTARLSFVIVDSELRGLLPLLKCWFNVNTLNAVIVLKLDYCDHA